MLEACPLRLCIGVLRRSSMQAEWEAALAKVPEALRKPVLQDGYDCADVFAECFQTE